MLKLTTLKSGSLGNCHLLTNGDINIMLDCGISIDQMGVSLFENGIEMDSIKYILITHEHQDHIQGLAYFKNTQTKIFMSEALKENPNNNAILKDLDLTSWSNVHWFKAIDREKGHGTPIFIKKYFWKITPIQSHHDAIDPCGFVVENNLGERLVYITDTGYVNINIKNAEIYLIEANHSRKYVEELSAQLEDDMKWKRVKSLKGHLSCEDAFDYIERNSGDKTKHVVYAHLSQAGFYNTKQTFRGREYLPSQEFRPKTYQVGIDDTPDFMKGF